MSECTTVWVSPSATAFACLCEHCLEQARQAGVGLADAIRTASVRGVISTETDVVFARCPARHEIVVRRVERPPGLGRRDDRQLQLA